MRILYLHVPGEIDDRRGIERKRGGEKERERKSRHRKKGEKGGIKRGATERRKDRGSELELSLGKKTQETDGIRFLCRKQLSGCRCRKRVKGERCFTAYFYLLNIDRS